MLHPHCLNDATPSHSSDAGTNHSPPPSRLQTPLKQQQQQQPGQRRTQRRPTDRTDRHQGSHSTYISTNTSNSSGNGSQAGSIRPSSRQSRRSSSSNSSNSSNSSSHKGVSISRECSSSNSLAVGLPAEGCDSPPVSMISKLHADLSQVYVAHTLVYSHANIHAHTRALTYTCTQRSHLSIMHISMQQLEPET